MQTVPRCGVRRSNASQGGDKRMRPTITTADPAPACTCSAPPKRAQTCKRGQHRSRHKQKRLPHKRQRCDSNRRGAGGSEAATGAMQKRRGSQEGLPRGVERVLDHQFHKQRGINVLQLLHHAAHAGVCRQHKLWAWGRREGGRGGECAWVRSEAARLRMGLETNSAAPDPAAPPAESQPPPGTPPHTSSSPAWLPAAARHAPACLEARGRL